MPIVTKATSYFVKGTDLVYTLDKTELAALGPVAADAYFSNQVNWNQVAIKMRSSTGNQSTYVNFNAADASPQGNMSTSAQARDNFEVDHLIIYDFDGGFFKVDRVGLVTSEFDVAKNDPPEAQSVSVSGTETVGQTLTANYTYFDADGDLEGATTFQWYRSDDGAGLNRAAIAGETASTYVLAGADLGKYIDCEVTPVAATGAPTGTAVSTGYTGAIS